MNVSWKTPTDDGGSPITGYIVECKELQRDIWTELITLNPKELNYTARNLKLNKLYAYRISAKNKYGTSEPVETKDFEAKYPFNVPDKPINAKSSEINSSSCLITFDPPHSDGGSPITGYYVERKDPGALKWQRVTNSPIQSLFYRSEDLIEGNEYEFRIIAENLAGLSKPSDPCAPFKAKNPYTRPGPPINVKVGLVTKSTIELSWDKPLSDGGSPITGYKIEKRNPKTLNWLPIQDLIISDLEYKFTGLRENAEYDFRIIATNLAGDGEPSKPTGPLYTKEKIVGEKPVLLEGMKDVRVMVGETARFTARIKSKPTPDIKWYHNERSLGYEHATSHIGDEVEIVLKNVQLKDEGSYKVVAKNIMGELSTDARLIVLKKPTIKYDSRFDRTIEIVAHQNLNISCEINGYPKPTVKWFSGKDEVNTTSRAVASYGEYISRLDIQNIQRNEGGKFSITAQNEVGKVDAQFTVKVLDIPMPPENFTVNDVTSTTCKLSWREPKDDGNVPITGYYIEKHDPKRGSFIRLDKTSLTECLVEKLQKGQTYQFRVIAENKVGLSQPTQLAEPVLAKGKFEVPSAPESPVASEITNTSCRISWEEPRNNGGTPIRGYFIERKCATRWVRINLDPETRKYITVRDLIQGMDYEFRVCAVNDEGEGPFSKPSDSFTAKNKYEKPEVPIYVDVRDITRSSCIVYWTPPQRTGGLPIVRYHIEMRAKGEQKFFRFTDDFISECEYEVAGLAENQEYEFRIVAETKKGLSLPSEPCKVVKAAEKIPGVLPIVDLDPEFGNLIGTQGKIQANIKGTPTPDIRWKKGSKLLSMNSSKYSISFAQSIAVIYINNLNEDDAGQYSCEAENSEGTDSKTCKFTVLAPPQIEYNFKYKKTSVVSVGSNFRIACQVTGCPKPAVVWSKDDSALTNDSKAKFDNPTENQHYLTIKQVDRNDSGSYIIKAANTSGKDEAKFNVQVVDVPDKPRGPIEVTLDSSNAQTATLEWKSPKWNGGSDLIGYTIEYAKILEPTFSKSLSWYRAGSVRPTTTSFIIDNLVRNCYYFFRITAENIIGQSLPLESEQALQAKPTFSVPNAPSGPLVISNIESNSCILSWGLPTDDGGSRVHSFVIEAREKKRSTWHQIDLVDVSDLSYKVIRLIENNSYYFRIAAKNNVGVGEPLYSDRPVVIMRPAGIPDAPFPLIVSDLQSDRCTLEWKAPTWTGGEDLEGYFIEMRVGDSRSGKWVKICTLEATAKQYQVLDLKEGEEYFFRISAFNRSGESNPLVLNRPVVPRKKITPPSPPTGPIIRLDSNKESITIQWAASNSDGGARITRYLILTREYNTPNWIRSGVVDSHTFEYKVNHLIENSDYHFRVVAENNVGQSDYLQSVEPIKARSPFTVPNQPEGPLAVSNITESSVNVSWNKPTDDGGSPIINYIIKRRDIRRPVWVTVATLSADKFSCRVKDLVDVNQYVVQIFAENAEGVSAALESESITLKSLAGPPSAPASIECIAVNVTSVTLQWEAPLRDGGSSVTSYLLEICDNPKADTPTWKVVRDSIDIIDTSFCVRNLIEGHKYLFRISATNDNGTSVAKSLDRSIRPRKMVQGPSQPGGPLRIVSMESDSLTVGWNRSEHDGGEAISNYLIEIRDINKADWTTVGIVNSTTYQYQIKNLIENNDYFVRVRAKNEARLTSNPLECFNFITIKSPYQVPSAPIGLRLVSVGKDNVILEFNESPHNGGLEIYRYIVEKRDSNRVTWIKAAKVTANLVTKVYQATVDELTHGSSFCFRVLAENQKGRSEPCELLQTISIAKDSEEPSKPLDLNIYHKSTSSAVLQWKAPLYNGNDKVNEYLIEEWNSISREWRLRGRCEPHLNSFVVNNLSNDLVYRFRVRASNVKGVSEPSLETLEYETLKQLSIPSVPSGPLRAKVSDDQTTIILNWSKSKFNGGSPIRRYIIEKLHNRNFMLSNEWYRIGVTTSEETQFKTSEYFIEDSSFSFRIIGENDVGRSVPLELTYPLTLERKKKIPEQPSYLRFRDKTATSINLVWKGFSADCLSSADRYRIEKREQNSEYWSRCGHTKLENFTVYDLDSNSSYFFRVIATNTAGDSKPSETQEPVSMDITNEVPSKPLTMYFDEITHDSVTLSWLSPKTSGAKPIIGYKIYQLATNDRDNRHWEEIGELNKSKHLTYTITGLNYNFIYKFRICAFNEIGIGKPNETDKIQIKKPIQPPSEPVNLLVRAVDNGEVAISWMAPYHNGNSQITGYVIERCEIHQNNEDYHSTNWMIHDEVDQFTHEYRLKNLYVGGLYSIRVAALNSGCTGKYAEIREHVIAKFKYSVPDAPMGPMVLTRMTRETVDATWGEPFSCGSSPLLSYFIEKRDLIERIWIKVARIDPDVKTLKINNLVEGHLYQLRVVAENEFGKSEPLQSVVFRPLRLYETRPSSSTPWINLTNAMPYIEDLYIIQEYIREELFFKYIAESPDATLWETIDLTKPSSSTAAVQAN